MKKLILIAISVLIAGVGVTAGGGSLTGGEADQTIYNRTMEASRIVYGNNATFVTPGEDKLLGKCEDGNLSFAKLERHGRVIYWHHRIIDGAIVELDRKVDIFDAETEELIESSVLNWRDDLPDHLPPIITKEEAEGIAGGSSATLYFIDPESIRFYEMTPTSHPCWVVWNSTEKTIDGYTYNRIIITAVDATNGEILGYGTPPPYEGFTSEGPFDDDPCTPMWPLYCANVKAWFENMGYPTLSIQYPNETQIRAQIQSNDIAVFYEAGHGNSFSFLHGCAPEPIDGRITNADDVQSWIADYPKMPFTLLYSCEAMANTGPGYFEYEFRKGVDTGTAVVGGYYLGDEPCLGTCGGYLDFFWQGELLNKLNQSWTVEEAFNWANDKWSACDGCFKFAGDPNLKLVPKVYRYPVVGHITGEVRDVNSNLLSNVEVSLYEYGNGLYGSDVASPDYCIEVNQTGQYWLLGTKADFYEIDTTDMLTIPPLHIDLTTPEKLAAGYVFDFEGDYGLVPRACIMSYVLKCVNLWKIGSSAHPEWNLSEWKAMDTANSWLYPS